VHFHSGTAEIEAEIRRLDGTAPIEPGTRTFVRLVLREPALLVPGDRFIIRMFSPVVTIGGGVVLDSAPPRRSGVERARVLASRSDAERIAVFIGDAPLGASLRDLVARTGLPDAAVRKSAQPFTGDWFIAPDRAQEIVETWRNALAAFHQSNPLLPGMSKEQLRGGMPPAIFEELLRREKRIVITGEVAHLATHRLALRQDEADAVAKIEAAFETAGLRVPAVAEVLGASGIDAGRARPLLQILLRNKKLVRVTDDLVFHHSALTTLRQVIEQHKGQRFGVGEFKDWTGISRKYAIPLLEMLDRERVTRRDGDARVVL
jgi:selenocysteine-specific elongation factor